MEPKDELQAAHQSSEDALVTIHRAAESAATDVP